jgi:8-oxo-dGTP pyrophosphatase MutT (NUDIX family)
MSLEGTLETKERIATRAVIVNSDGKVLIIRESGKYVEGNNVGRYDFPGGRVELNEDIQTALLREVKEECGLDVDISRAIFVGEWNPTINNVHLKIRGTFFQCIPKNLDVALGSDHDDYEWIYPKDAENYDLIPPNKEVLKKIATKNL